MIWGDLSRYVTFAAPKGAVPPPQDMDDRPSRPQRVGDSAGHEST